MTYEEILGKRNISSNIPLVYEGRELSREMKATVVLMKVSYDKVAAEFDKDMQEVLKGLKKEGFDDRSRDIQKMEEIDKRKKAFQAWKKGAKDEKGNDIPRPTAPTDEELKEIEKIRETKENYDDECKELDELYRKAYIEKLKETVKFTERKFSASDLAEIIGMLGTDGDMVLTVNGIENRIAKEAFISLVAANLVIL